MFSDMLHDMLSKNKAIEGRIKHRKATKDLMPSTIMIALENYKPLPIKQTFKPDELVTQIITKIDPKDGEPMRRFSFPLPGQPARVIGMIENPKFISQEEGDANYYEDLLIAVAVAQVPPRQDFEVREYVVSSRYFRPYLPGETVDLDVAEYLDAQAAKLSSED